MSDLELEASELLAHLNAVPFSHEYRMDGETYGQIVDVLRRLLDDRAQWVGIPTMPIGKLFGWDEPTWRNVAKWAGNDWRDFTGPDHVEKRLLLRQRWHVEKRLLLRQRWLDAGGSMDGVTLPPTPPA